MPSNSFVIHQARCNYLAGVHSVLMNPYSSVADIEISLVALHNRLEDNRVPQEQKTSKALLALTKNMFCNALYGTL